MPDIFDSLDSGDSSQGSSPSDIFDQAASLPSKQRSLASAATKGLVKGGSDLASLNPMGGTGPIPESVQRKIIEKLLPTRKEKGEKYLERAGRLAPLVATGGEGLIAKAAQLGGGTLAGQLAEESGAGEMGQGISEAIGTGVPGLARSGAKKIQGLLKAPVEKLKSGITKPRALDAKHVEKGIIGSERQSNLLSKLDKEAASLTKSSVESRLPMSKLIEEGFDFDSKFQKGFGDLQKSAEKANPTIDITPISDLMIQTARKYKGIPNLHPEAKKIMNEVRGLSSRPQTTLKNLLKIYRSNNQKKNSIYETSRLTGRQKEYVDFLNDVNRSIAKSFEDTLPKESQWVKDFKQLNSEYSQVQRSKEALAMLEPILQERATPDAFKKLAHDSKKQKKLILQMGEEGANEVIQIAKDVDQVRSAIRKIPVKDMKLYEAAMPLSILIPGMKIPAAIAIAKKGSDYARRGYGIFLTTPARRKAYDSALKALIENDLPTYTKATATLKSEIDSESD